MEFLLLKWFNSPTRDWLTDWNAGLSGEEGAASYLTCAQCDATRKEPCSRVDCHKEYVPQLKMRTTAETRLTSTHDKSGARRLGFFASSIHLPYSSHKHVYSSRNPKNKQGLSRWNPLSRKFPFAGHLRRAKTSQEKTRADCRFGTKALLHSKDLLTRGGFLPSFGSEVTSLLCDFCL